MKPADGKENCTGIVTPKGMKYLAEPGGRTLEIYADWASQVCHGMDRG